MLPAGTRQASTDGHLLLWQQNQEAAMAMGIMVTSMLWSLVASLMIAA
jgi:hypothetical protein